jgi:hypothetical protein
MWKPRGDEPFAFPSLGLQVADAMSAYLAAPDRLEYEPFEPTLEQIEFLYRLYEVDAETGRRRVKHRAVLSRSRGWGKSPFLGAIGSAEGLFDVVPDGFDANGQPVGKPWSTIRTPLVLVTAVAEEQTANTWSALLEMLRNGPAIDEFDIDPMDTFVSLPSGRIETRTSSARTVKGARAVCSIMDQTEEWVQSNGGIKFAQTLRNNATKLGGVSIESPNAFTPGENSVAEQSSAFWDALKEGKSKADSRPILYDHREAPATTDPESEESLIAGLRVAYGDSSDHEDGCVLHTPPCPPGWSPIKRIAADFWDLSNDPQVMRADFLNQITHAADSWISQPELASINATKRADQGKEPVKEISRGDVITLGFDGSRGRTKRKPDATALVGCRVSDGFLFKLGVWEAPDGPAGENWTVPETLVDAAVTEAFAKYRVVGFYADPEMWDGHVARWESRWGKNAKVQFTREKPFAFNTRQISKVVAGFESLHNAIINEEVVYDGSYDLTRHFLNARREKKRAGIVLRKPNDDYLAKIDAAYASMLAFICRMDAIGKGIGASTSRSKVRRIR